MRHLNYSHLIEINKQYKFLDNIDYLVETGSYKGGTINNLQKHIKYIYSIELNKYNYDICSNNFQNSNIKLYNCDSVSILDKIIDEIDSRIIYFLDAHFSNNNKIICAKSYCDVPILDELKIILKKDLRNSIIIINNYRLFGTSSCEDNGFTDWTNITLDNIINIIGNINIEAQFLLPSSKTKKKNDKYIIILKNRLENNKIEKNLDNNITQNIIIENPIINKIDDIKTNEIITDEDKIELTNEIITDEDKIELTNEIITEENKIELTNEIITDEDLNNKLDLIFYKNGYSYNNEFKSSLISQNRTYLGQLLKMKDQLNLNIIDKREVFFEK